MMEAQYDIIIVGTGLVGNTLACALAGSGLKVALLEKSMPAAPQPVDLRPITLNFATVNILKSLGLWSVLATQAAPISRLMVSQQGRFGALNLTNEQLNVPMLGAVVSYDDLMQCVYHAAVEQATLVSYADIESIQQRDDRVELVLQSLGVEKKFSASLLVVADGAKSPCRDLLNINVVEENRRDAAMTFQLSLRGSHGSRAHLRFSKQGSIAVLPLFSEDQARLVWTMSENNKAELLTSSTDDLRDKFNTIYKGYLSEIDQVRFLSCYSLQILQAREQVQQRAVLLGNAARSFYPITAQGFNLASRNVAALAQLVVRAHQANKDIGAKSLLQSYLAWRAPDQQAVGQMTMAIGDLFGLHFPGLSVCRGLGLAVMDALPGVKKQLGRRFLGMADKAPDLALGVPL